MPEGHTIHRLARHHEDAFHGRRLTVSSPQGRFSDGATWLDGRRLEQVEAYGKHLFYRFAGGFTLHVHLGLVGTFTTHQEDAPPPSNATRLAMSAEGTTVYLTGPMLCELIDPAEEEQIISRLGPDPLRGDADPELAWQALSGRRSPIGAVLLDQSVLAGIGNVYRAEGLFLEGVHPDTSAQAIDRARFRGLWERLVSLLRAGVRDGRIVTVEAGDRAVPRANLSGEQARYVYRRDGLPCHRCGTEIRSWDLGGRPVYACPSCQPR